MEAAKIVSGDHWDPFSFLGMHIGTDGRVNVRAFIPDARCVSVVNVMSSKSVDLPQVDDINLFAGPVATDGKFFPYRLRSTLRDGRETEIEDPYRFSPVLSELDVHLLAEGNHLQSFDKLGAQMVEIDGVRGVNFAVWAPNARRVSVVGDFNLWDGRVHPMRIRHECGIWEIFLPGLGAGVAYKFEIRAQNGEVVLKADPYAYSSETPPRTASLIHGALKPPVKQTLWQEGRNLRNVTNAPIAIYEVHLGSWRRKPEENNRPLTYSELGEELIPYVKDMGFTHIEIMPISEYPFDGSWGYQPTGLFAPTHRHGRPEDFQNFVGKCHSAGIGVILDWVAGHFPDDEHGLAKFDGTHLYEHDDPRLGRHRDWDTLVYNYGRQEVANFLLSNALYWLDRFDIDGLRCDAVAAMLYLDYSRDAGEWLPNRYGGRENLEAVDFLKRLNTLIYDLHPHAMTIAEESTAWPMVSRPAHLGGLGFGYKWNMGWMNDTLRYMSRDPIHRRFHHDDMTFGLLYAFTENFILPLSHDEVVHGKGSLLSKMPGDRQQQFDNFRAYLGFMYTHPGKKLLFMGAEFAQNDEWNHDHSLEWHLLANSPHEGVQCLVRDLNHLYRGTPALHELDCNPDGFSWIDSHDRDASVLSYLRRSADGEIVLVVCNFTPTIRHQYRIGVPINVSYDEVLNTDSEYYGGSNVGNGGRVVAADISAHGQPFSISLTLPPLSTLVLRPVGER